MDESKKFGEYISLLSEAYSVVENICVFSSWQEGIIFRLRGGHHAFDEGEKLRNYITGTREFLCKKYDEGIELSRNQDLVQCVVRATLNYRNEYAWLLKKAVRKLNTKHCSFTPQDTSRLEDFLK